MSTHPTAGRRLRPPSPKADPHANLPRLGPLSRNDRAWLRQRRAVYRRDLAANRLAGVEGIDAWATWLASHELAAMRARGGAT